MRFSLEDGAACPILSVGCAFNHQRVCANAQHDDALATTSFLFEDPGLWHMLEVPRSEAPGPSWCVIALVHATLYLLQPQPRGAQDAQQCNKVSLGALIPVDLFNMPGWTQGAPAITALRC